MPYSDETRRGRERQGVNEHALEIALKDWEEATPEERPKCAFILLSHLGAEGKTLREYVTDKDKAKKIKDHADRALSK